MIQKYFSYIALTLLAIIMIQGFLNESNDEAGELYRNRIEELTSQKIDLIQKNNDLENKINNFKDERTKIDSITDSYTPMQVDSFFANYFAR